MARQTGELDREIGTRVRMARIAKGLSQERLGAELGITFQQIQKYEQGRNRISAAALVRIAEALETDLMYFFGGAPSDGNRSRTTFAGATDVDFDILRHLIRITDASAKRHIANLVKAMEVSQREATSG